MTESLKDRLNDLFYTSISFDDLPRQNSLTEIHQWNDKKTGGPRAIITRSDDAMLNEAWEQFEKTPAYLEAEKADFQADMVELWESHLAQAGLQPFKYGRNFEKWLE